MKIVAENVGPIRKVDIDVTPGLNVLRGANGSGKSTLLQAVNFALTKTGDKPTPRDGTRAGKLDCFGVQASFTSRATLKGNLEVESLSGRLDLGDLIAPGYESEEVNDARRIKRLIELSGAQATVEMFAPIFGQSAIQAGLDGDLPTDLIDAADWAKRELQEQAREAEQQAERMALQAAAARKAAEGVDLTIETDAERLNEEYVQSSAELATLQREQQQRAERLRVAAEARAKMERVKAGAVPIPVAEANERYATFSRQRAEHLEVIEGIKQQLQEATFKLTTLTRLVSDAHEQIKRSQGHEAAMAAWESQVKASENLQPVADEEIQSARAAADAARKSIETGALARKAKEQLAAADDFKRAADKAGAKAAQLRANAAATDNILAAELQRIGCPWRPVDVPTKSGSVRRLVVQHKRGEQTLVSDLSEGERAKHAIDVALELSGKSDRPAVLILRQEVFEGLQPKVRDEIDKHAKAKGVVILTAAASDDEEVII